MTTLTLRAYAPPPMFWRQPAATRCRCCKATLCLSAFRARARGKTLCFRLVCRSCEAKQRAPKCSSLPAMFKAWAGPVLRPFVGFCLIDARGLVNLISLDQEKMT
jgi:hypothetical protein